MSNKSLFSRFLTNKKVLFIVSVALAFIFWILTSDNITKTFTDVPIKYNLPESVSSELEIYSASDEFVSVTVDGKRVAVESVTADKFLASVDLSSVTEACEKSFNVDVKTNDSISFDITKIEPSNITLMIDKPMTKTVELKYDFTYSPEGYYVENNVPSSVEISGPESYVEKVQCAYINGNVVSANATTVTNNYKITLYDNINPHSTDANVINSEYISLSYSNVDVTFKYFSLEENVPFSIVDDEGLTVPSKYFSVNPGSISVAVPEAQLNENGELESLPINIGRLSQYENEIYNLSYIVKDEILTSDMVNKSDGIEKVYLRLDFSGLESVALEVPNSRCQIKNLPEGYAYTMPESFSVIAIGKKADLAKLDPEKIDIILDFETVKPTTDNYVDVPVDINLNTTDFCWVYRQSPVLSVLLTNE